MRGGGDRLDGLEFTETQVFKNLKAFVILVPLLRTTPHMYLLSFWQQTTCTVSLRALHEFLIEKAIAI